MIFGEVRRSLHAERDLCFGFSSIVGWARISEMRNKSQSFKRYFTR